MRKLIACLVALVATTAANAAVIYQSIPNLAASPATNAWCSSCGGSWRVFDTFSVADASSIDSVSFNVQTNYFFPTPVTVSVWTVSAGVPGTQLLTQTFTPGQFDSVVNNSGVNTSTVKVSPTGWSLAAGNYYISFYNPSNLGVPGYGSSGGIFQSFTSLPSGGGSPRNQTAGFLVEGNLLATPEPVSLFVFGTLLVGGAGVALRRRMTAKATA